MFFRDSLDTLNRSRPLAWKTVWIATSDYSLARLGFLHGNASAGHIAHQAIEKFLKGLIYYRDHQASPISLKRALAPLIGRRSIGHELSGLSQLLKITYGVTVSSIDDYVGDIDRAFRTRYPDAALPTFFGNSENDNVRALGLVDRIVFDIWDQYKSFDRWVYYVTGIGGIVVPSIIDATSAQTPRHQERVQQLAMCNAPYSLRSAEIERGIRSFYYGEQSA